MNPSRILLTTDAVGGVWTHALDLAAGLGAAGHVVRLVVLGPAPTGDQVAAATGAGIDLVVLPHGLDWLAPDADAVKAAGRAIAAAGSAWGADIVHLHAPAYAADARFAMPVVATQHSCVATWWDAVETGPLPPDLAWRKTIAAAGLARVDRVLAPTQAYARQVAAVYGLAAAPLTVLNGRRAPADAFDDGEPEEAVLTAGRLWDMGKDVAALDRAAALLPLPVRAAGPIAGPDGSTLAVRHLDCLGPLSASALRERLRRRPIFATAARFEPFGLAVLEAAQAGCALVLNDIPTFRELWDGVALFVEAADDIAFAAAIHNLIDDRIARRSLGAAARRRAASYTIERHVEATLAVYDSCRSMPEAARVA